MAKSSKVLAVNSDAELLSYIINQNPILSAEIDLPVQGQSIKHIGQIIVNNERYKNAFINTVNVIGLTVIKRNAWENPWEFTNRGTLRFGQQIREIVNDLCNVYDYNSDTNTVTRFLDNVVPNLFNYIHEINFQKFYQQTTSDAQISMAFENEGNLFQFIDDSVSMMYESWKYDKYIIDKYMLCRRILDGTVTPTPLSGYDNMSARQRVSALKSVSNKMTFRSANYNPAGVNRATNFDEQIMIVNTDFEADFSTDVMATSFFRDEADMRARMVLIDGFDNHDTKRLSEVLADAYVAFTDDELSQLSKITGVLISKDWFMDYMYTMDNMSDGTLTTDFYNPTTLKNNHFLHVWAVFSTSPFENATVFTADVTPTVTSVTVSPSTASVTKGQTLALSANVDTVGFANKGVTWSVNDDSVKIDANGVLTVPSTTAATSVTVTATSVFDTTKSCTATITVS